MGGILILSDVISLFMASLLMLWLWSFVRSDLNLQNYLSLIPFLSLFIISFGLTGLYSSNGISPIEELRLLSLTTSFVYFALGTFLFWTHSADMYSRASFCGGWILAIIFLPFSRDLFRTFFSALEIWGEPIAIVGEGKECRDILNYIIKNPKMGMKPVALMTNDNTLRKVAKCTFEIFSSDQYDEFLSFSRATGIQRIMVISLQNFEQTSKILIKDLFLKFSSVIVVPNMTSLSDNIWIYPFYLGYFPIYEAQQNLLRRSHKLLKRMLDITLASLLLVIFIPLFGLISLVIIIDSPGNVFYKHKRIGQNGKQFDILKFRTMHQNVDIFFNNYLQQNEEVRKEWETYHKLKKDIRITRVGHLFRRFSLDELPQLWNVWRGEMSLVGPRPIVQKEVLHYGHAINMYKLVKPGLTGLWQVSGRNSVKFSQRIKLDEYYVYNWSIWMDLYILGHTIIAVLKGNGSY